MELERGNRVRYVGEIYEFENDASKEGGVESISDDGTLVRVLFDDYQELSCYEEELELIKGEK